MSRSDETFPSYKPARKSGRAVFDEYGRTTWEWQTSTGVFERHISEEQLHALAGVELQLAEPTRSQPVDAFWLRTARSKAPVTAARVVRSSWWSRIRRA